MWSPGFTKPEDREVVGLGAAAGEDDLGGAAAEQLGHRLARALDRRPRLLSMMVDGRRVAEVLAEVGPHGLQHLGQHGRGRVVVEIDSAHRCLYFTLAAACGGQTGI